MIPEIGHLALWLALGTALLLAVLPLRGAALGRPAWMQMAGPLTGWLALFVGTGYAALSWAFASADFSVAYVAQHANRELPLAYRLAAVWGGHEGSLLLWVSLLAGWMLALRAASGAWPEALRARVLGLMGALAAGFLVFLLAASNPFERVLPAVPDGNDLNPLLQDPGMVLHPPMLYMGYVGFTVAFAFALAALLGSEITPAWARRARAWTLAAWCSLTLGIALGSWWAYSELGWGGWWFWDPVENASFMPWLAGTALLHSLAVTEKRGAFKAWTVLLAVLTFGLALLGTFLVRSGVLSSVHAFATDPRRGLFILAFLVIVVGGSLALYASRAGRLGLGARFDWRSRETALLANNAMLVAAGGAVLLGTLYPLLLDALLGQKLSVGPPYFEAVFVPLMVPVVLLMGLGPLLSWKQADLGALLKRLRWPLLLAPLATAAHAWVHGLMSPAGLMGLLLAWWVAATVAADLGARWRNGVPRAVLAMHLAHAGVAVFIVGVTMVGSLQTERDVTLAPGRAVDVNGLRVEMLSLRRVEGPNYRAAQAELKLSQGGVEVARLRPEKRVYNSSEMPMTEAGIDSGWWRDLYASLAEPLDGERGRAWIVRISIKPYVNWIWGGCVLMALGGLLAATDRRYRRGAAA
ncbi:heme lyase CcmF/NrfE family subunit [Roseateles sp. BYS87W]|uniref:Heme lyase CcmF/NrfE family subunit n=1 Tax=Pelomonas baiyunensis TaxID=3299026 RepID=A0ABW7GTL6_9BURK